MRIGIDCRMAGTGEGIGRYVEELIKHLALIVHENDYYLLCNENSKLKIQNSKFRNVIVYSKYYSFAEQTRLIWELKRLKLDLVHFTNFNHPILYPGKFVVTIHDLIHNYFPGKKKSRFFQRLAYRAVMHSAIKRSSKIIAVSESTKYEILKYYRVPEDKVAVIYEGVDERMSKGGPSTSLRDKYMITKPYILCVGVWRQYKNLPRLARAFDILKVRHDIQLVLAGKMDPFYPEVRDAVMKSRYNADIRPLGFVSNEDLSSLYRRAAVFVLPSLIEGFGLGGVEAQATGAPVAASDIPVLREVLGGGAIYFDPQSEQDMAKKINKIMTDSAFASALMARGKANADRYIWVDAARRTLDLYISSISTS